MDIPKYLLKVNEGNLVPKNDNPIQGYLKKAVIIIVGILVIGSFIFQDNLFGELSLGARILLIVIGISVWFSGGGSHRVPSPIEIQFYDDYLIVYREKCYYDRKVTRKEYNHKAWEGVNYERC